MPTELTLEEEWYKMLTEGEPVPRHLYHLLGLLPSDPRCKLCAAPFKSWGGLLMHLLGRDQSRYNPRFCVKCEVFDHPGGAEVQLTMLFADVRGSTRIAEQMSAREFGQLMNRFYTVASHILIQSDAMVDRLLGDEAIGLYIPGFAGQEHSRKAVEAAQNLLKHTGHNDSKGPWLPVGIFRSRSYPACLQYSCDAAAHREISPPACRCLRNTEVASHQYCCPPLVW